MCVCSLSYPACKAHEQLYIVTCGLFGFTIYIFFSPTFPHKLYDFRKKITEHTVYYVFGFSLRILSGKFFILRRIQRDIATKFTCTASVNRLAPNDIYVSRNAQLNTESCILNIYSKNILTEYFKHAAYSPSFSLQDAVYFIMLSFLVPVISTFYIESVLKY